MLKYLEVKNNDVYNLFQMIQEMCVYVCVCVERDREGRERERETLNERIMC